MSRRNPFRELEELFERMSHGVDDAGTFGSAAPVDVAETDSEFVVTVDLPGYDREEIEVTLDDRELTVAAERDRESTETDEHDRYIRRERSRSAVSRSVNLPEPVVVDEVGATYRNGVLTVTLPKTDAADEGHHIDVE
jgi:HSP20 family protein